MMQQMRWAIGAVALSLSVPSLTGCTKHPDPDSGLIASPSAKVMPEAVGSPQPAGNEGLVQSAAAAVGAGFVTQTVLVRREASDAREIDGPAKKKKVANWMATLYRGEQVEVLSSQDPWLHLRLSDGKEGFAKSESVVTGSVELATVFERVKTFTRPDLLALNAAKQLEPGALLFVLRAKDQFSEVNVGGAAHVWVLSDVLIKDAKEVEAAKLINRSRALKERPAANEAESQAPLELAKSQFASTKLVQILLMPQPTLPPTDEALPAPTPETADPPAAPE